MDHLAVMKKSWGFTQKILNGEKTIESRWYKTRRAPWKRIKKNDTVYFKNSGEPVTIKAIVSSVVEFEELTPKRVKEILGKHWGDLGISKNEVSSFYKRVKNKKYCILIFLENPKKIEPFKINKKGFGSMASWICIEDIKRLKF
jgi:ASC-1-like (ASCH) protein